MNKTMSVLGICGVVFLLAIGGLTVTASAEDANSACETALKHLMGDKKTKTLPYVCPKQLGAQLESVLARVKENTPKGYTFQKAVLHIETGSTTEIDAGLNLVVFTISYKGKKGLTQSMDSNFGLPEKKELQRQMNLLDTTSLITTDAL